MASVRVGGLEFFGGAGSDGFYIEGEGLQGLLSGVDVKRDSVSRPQAHGDFDVPGFLESRVVSIAGPCLADSAEKLSEYGRQITGLLADGAAMPVTFDVPGGPLWGMARLAAKTEFDVTLWGSQARYQLSLLFANPRLYGEAHGFEIGTYDLVNYGNFPAAPVYTVTGSSAGGYVVYGPAGKSFHVTRALNAGEIHTIDMADGYLRVNGVVVYGGIGSPANAWLVPGGGSVGVTVSDAAIITGRISDTYI